VRGKRDGPHNRVLHNQTEPSKESIVSSRELSAEELRFSTKIDRKFSSTRELTGAKEFFGQERALAALELGLGISGSGYNIFVSGLTGAEKLETLRDWVAQRAAKAPTPAIGSMSTTSNTQTRQGDFLNRDRALGSGR
jgi:hypothetical protein